MSGRTRRKAISTKPAPKVKSNFITVSPPFVTAKPIALGRVVDGSNPNTKSSPYEHYIAVSGSVKKRNEHA
jgi:hypothetical protein